MDNPTLTYNLANIDSIITDLGCSTYLKNLKESLSEKELAWKIFKTIIAIAYAKKDLAYTGSQEERNKTLSRIMLLQIEQSNQKILV